MKFLQPTATVASDTVVFERGPMSHRSQVRDLPGCVAVGETKAEACGLIREAIEFYIDALEEDGQAVPVPGSSRGN